MNLADFNFGETEKNSTRGFAPGLTAGTGLFSDYEKERNVATAPCWRKSRGQKVDEKIEKLKLMFANAGSEDEDVDPLIQSDS